MSERLSLFLRSSLYDALLVLVVAGGLAFAVLSGFKSTMELRYDGLLFAGLAVPLLLILFAGAWSKRAVPLAAAGAVVYGAVALGLASFLMPSEVPVLAEGRVNDVPGNYLVYVVVVLAVTVLVYLLSRRPIGAVILLVAGVVVCGSVQFLFADWAGKEGGLACFAVVFIASGALLVYQRYRSDARAAQVLARPAFGAVFCQALVLAALCAGLGAVGFGALVEPLGLETPLIKPFERTIARPIVEYTGIYDEMAVTDPEQGTSRTTENEEDTASNAEGGVEDLDEAQGSSPSPLAQLVGSLTAFNGESWDEAFSPSSLERLVPWAVGVLGILFLLVALAVAARLGLRRWRLRRLASRPWGERVVALYRFLLRRLRYVGLEKPPSLTPLEFAFSQQRAMAFLNRGTGGVDFVQVTLWYQRAAYGESSISAEEYQAVERYYRAFFKNMHAHMGTLRWLRYFWIV